MSKLHKIYEYKGVKLMRVKAPCNNNSIIKEIYHHKCEGCYFKDNLDCLILTNSKSYLYPCKKKVFGKCMDLIYIEI